MCINRYCQCNRPSRSFSSSTAVIELVLATLVENKELPDPFYGLENKSIIDIADSGREHYTFWFFTKFQCKLAVNQHVDLNFRAINYSTEVYLNGHKRELGKGMFRRHSLDVTDILSPDNQNLLAVWQEFWITGDVDGRGDPISNPNGPLDHDLFLLLRNHASLALWVGGNEQIPPEDINAALKHDLRLSDNSYANGVLMEKVILMSDTDPSQYLDGTRVYVQRSMWDGFADGKGNFTDGPYEIQNPEDFFKDSYYKYGFNLDVALLLNPSMSS